MDGTLFFPLGIGLVVVALVLSAIGIRGKDKFPPSRPVMVGLTLLFAAVVVSTASIAVVNAREEKDHRDEELAEEQEHAEAEQPAPPPAGAPPKSGAPPGGTPPSGAETQLDVTSPEDGSLMFDPDALDAPPGLITLAYDNPSPVPHNINIEGDGGTLAESDDVTGGAVEISTQLGPGEYVFFCSIPGHREGGMEGDLVVE